MDGGSRVRAAGVQSVRRRARRRRPAGGRGLSPQHPAEKGAWREQARTTSGQICTVQGRAQAPPRCDALSIPPAALRKLRKPVAPEQKVFDSDVENFRRSLRVCDKAAGCFLGVMLVFQREGPLPEAAL